MKFNAAKLLAHFVCWLPLLYVIFGAFNRWLGADPQERVLHLMGYWALVFLLIGLSISPFRRLSGVSGAIKYRRLLGLYAAFYMSLHIMMFIAFYLYFDLLELVNEIVERPYITLGMMAFLLTIPLAATSTLKMQRLLGRRWKKLHQLVYLVAILAVIHFIWQSKSDLNEPLIYAIWLLALLAIRVYWACRRSI